MQFCAAVQATYRKQHPNFEWRGGGGKGVDFFVLWSHSILVQYLNNFVHDWSLVALTPTCFL